MSPLLYRVVLLCLFFLTPSAFASPVPGAPDIPARGFLLIDYDSGRVLAEKNPEERLEPASLTKMMTAYVVFHELKDGRLSLSDKVRVSEKAWRTPGSRMFIEVDKSVVVEDLLKGLIIQSGNDASVALAEHVAGSESAFAQLMNEYASRLGMQGSHFMNATGLPDEQHYTTARDLAALAMALIRDFPEHYHWHAQKKFTFNDITQYNRNKLLWRDESVDGLKTGHTESAGFCLVATAKRTDMRLVAVVLGSKSEKTRASEAQSLLNYGFRFYETHRLYEGLASLTQVRVWKGAQEKLGVGLQEDLFVTVPRGQYKKLSASMELSDPILAPVGAGQRQGTLSLTLAGETLLERPLISLRAVGEGGMWQRLKDHVRLMFN